MAERENATAKPVEREFPCLYRTAHGRIFSYPELCGVVIEFEETCLVLKPVDFQRLKEHITRVASCHWIRSHFAQGERIRLQDSTGAKALILDLPNLLELADLMSTGALRLNAGETVGAAVSPSNLIPNRPAGARE